jgi:hypothetical protein
MTPGVRRFALTTHVVSSVGWLGAVLGFLALALAGLRTPAEPVARAAYVAMNLITWLVIVPLCLLSLATGVIGSLGTPWGLVRHYWVLVKLILTVVSTLLLFLHTRPIGLMARAALGAAPVVSDLTKLRAQLVFDSAAAAFVLLGAAVLAVYKPRGLTPYGVRREVDPEGSAAPN